jgi:hippurate hydrolase
MGGEDFGRLAKVGVPICMLRLGAVSQKRLDEFAARHQPPTSLHSPLFYPDIEETLKTGVPTLAYVATDLLKPVGKPAAK